MGLYPEAQGPVKVNSAILDLVGSEVDSTILDLVGSNHFHMAVSFLTKSSYPTNCDPILENPDHA